MYFVTEHSLVSLVFITMTFIVGGSSCLQTTQLFILFSSEAKTLTNYFPLDLFIVSPKGNLITIADFELVTSKLTAFFLAVRHTQAYLLYYLVSKEFEY